MKDPRERYKDGFNKIKWGTVWNVKVDRSARNSHFIAHLQTKFSPGFLLRLETYTYNGFKEFNKK